MENMNELIAINYENEMPTISGRELHEALEVKTAYKDWFPRMCEYGFQKGVDFNPLKNEQVQIEGNREVKREITDHEITINMAKEICMLQRNEKGKMFRQYFLKVEEAWNSPEMVMGRALKISEALNKKLMADISLKDKRIEEMRPKEIFADSVASSNNCILIGDLAKILKQNGIEMGQRRLFEWLRKKGYLIKRQGADYNSPTQRSMERGLFEIKETAVTHADGHISVNKTTKVTGKGQIYFINLFKKAEV